MSIKAQRFGIDRMTEITNRLEQCRHDRLARLICPLLTVVCGDTRGRIGVDLFVGR